MHGTAETIRANGGLNGMWLELTNKCNLSCVHCYNASSPYAQSSALDQRDFENVISEAAAAGCQSIQFIGGEPTVSYLLIPLMKYAAAMKLTFIEIYSNLFSVSNNLVATAKATGAVFATSFYSHVPEIHDAITMRRGSFARTSESIRRLVGAGLDVRAGFIEMEENRGHLTETERYLHALGVKTIGRDVVRGFGRAARGSKNNIDELCGACGQGTLCINYDGTVSPCVMSKFLSLGRVGQSSLISMVAGSALKEFRQRLIKTKNDSMCPPSGCEPNCNPQCSPNCQPCYPWGKCDPEIFR